MKKQNRLKLIVLFLIAAAVLMLLAGVKDMPDNKLYGKSALFCGDSISFGAFDSEEGRAWAGRIGEKYRMDTDNRSVNGSSLSSIRKERIVDQLEGAKEKSFDYVIIQGGVNDAWGDGHTTADLGEISMSFSIGDFDTTTFSGGLEEILCAAKKYFPQAKIGFIITFSMPNAVGIGKLTDMEEYYSKARQICEKWSVAYLDLYNDDYVNQILLCTDEYIYMYDPVHPNSLGYDRLATYIAEWMESI